MARKQKEEVVTVTHTEILGLAIQRLTYLYQKDKELGLSIWKDKLLILLQLYKIETGNDYGLDIDLE